MRRVRRAIFPKLLAVAVTAAALTAGGAARAEMEPQPVVKLRALDKITARTMTFEADVGSTVKFGPLFIKVRACHKAPPIETPEAASFLQIWENSFKDGKPQWVFSGWMFASSPALSPMDHPVYDVWLLDCLEAKTGTAPATEEDEESAGEETQAAPKPAVPPATAPGQEEDIVEEEAPPSPDDAARGADEEEDAFDAPYDAPR